MNERGLHTARLGRRILALLIDWAIASAISAGFFDFDELATLGVFAVMTWILVSLTGATIGHTLLRLVVRGLDGRPGPGRAAIRTVALCLVIPAVVWGPDGRGLHDVWAGTVITRR